MNVSNSTNLVIFIFCQTSNDMAEEETICKLKKDIIRNAI